MVFGSFMLAKLSQGLINAACLHICMEEEREKQSLNDDVVVVVVLLSLSSSGLAGWLAICSDYPIYTLFLIELMKNEILQMVNIDSHFGIFPFQRRVQPVSGLQVGERERERERVVNTYTLEILVLDKTKKNRWQKNK